MRSKLIILESRLLEGEHYIRQKSDSSLGPLTIIKQHASHRSLLMSEQAVRQVKEHVPIIP